MKAKSNNFLNFAYELIKRPKMSCKTQSDLVKRMKVEIEIAILTVPSPVAQEVADMLVNANIKYIWNFATTILEVPETIKICNKNLMGNFLDFTKN